MEHGPVHTTMKSALDETEEIIYDVTEELLKKTGVKASEVCGNLSTKLNMKLDKSSIGTRESTSFRPTNLRLVKEDELSHEPHTLLQCAHSWLINSRQDMSRQVRLALQIGIVMVSCSCFAPTPSMAAMIVNRFKMRPDVLTYNLSGMGCSSSLVCVDMAKHLLKALPNTMALIINHENITQNWSVATLPF